MIPLLSDVHGIRVADDSSMQLFRHLVCRLPEAAYFTSSWPFSVQRHHPGCVPVVPCDDGGLTAQTLSLSCAIPSVTLAARR